MIPKELERAMNKSNKIYDLIRMDVSQETLNRIDEYVELQLKIEGECSL